MIFFFLSFNQTQLERHENAILRQENEKLRVENGILKEAMRNPTCNNCGGAATPGEVSHEQQQLRMENAKLKYELEKLCALANRYIGGSISLEQPSNGGVGSQDGFTRGTSTFMDLAVVAMDELIRLAEVGNPLWSEKDSMNHDEYTSHFACSKHPGFAAEGSRETGLVLMNSLTLVETLMDTV